MVTPQIPGEVTGGSGSSISSWEVNAPPCQFPVVDPIMGLFSIAVCLLFQIAILPPV